MKRFWIVVIVAGIAILGMSALQYLARPAAGDAAPDFELPSLAGKPVRLSGFAGRPVLLHFWASWCGPCREEFPVLSRLQSDFADEGLIVLAVSEDDEPVAIRSFVDYARPSFAVLLDEGGAVADSYQSFAVPETIFIDRAGMIAWRHAGPIDWDSPDARGRVEELIGGNGGN